MKIIDLLNKIAKGEEVPTRIKYKNDFYEYAEWYQGYRNETKTDDEDYEILLLSRLIDKQVGTSFLNDEIEIIEEDIEEDKPIEKITIDLNYANHYSKANVKANGKYLAEKINEIIDVVNELKERE